MSRTAWISSVDVKKSTSVKHDDDEKVDFSYKIVLVGDSGTGKSNITSQFVDEKFNEFTKTTMGIDFKTKRVIFGNVNISVQMWDTAGQERFKSVGRSYYHESCAIIIVYDITRKSTFDSIPSWIKEIQNSLDVDISEVEIMIIGNKTDLEKQRVVSHYDVKKLEELCNFTYVETSAKNNVGVTEAMTTLIKNIHQRGIGNQKSFNRLNINDADVNKSKDSNCCIIL